MRKLVLTAALAALIVSPALAQFPVPGRGLLSGMLILQKSVQDELKLTEKQTDELKETQKAMMRSLIESFKDLGFDKEKIAEKMKELSDKNKKDVSRILTAAQNARLGQLEVQFGGLQSLASKDLADDLKLTEGQRDKVRNLSEEFAKSSREIMSEAGRDPKSRAEAMAKIQKLGRDLTTKAVGDFNPDQRARWQELTGAPFEFRLDLGGFLPGIRPGKDS